MHIAVYDPRLSASVLGKTGGSFCTALQLAVALSTTDHTVHLLYEGELSQADLTQHLGFQLPKVALVPATPSEAGMSGITSHYDIFLNASEERFIRSKARVSHWFCPFPSRPHLSLNANQALRTYQQLVTVSAYARNWFKQSWHRDAAVLHPLVRPIVPDYPKRQVIVSVGDFFAGRNNLKQGALISAFCEMVDDGLKNWELHLIGQLDQRKDDDRAYFTKLDLLVGDYPVFLHFNAPQEDALNIISHAAIYWHAAGFDEDLKRHPNWVAPFNTALVEAMSAGSAPVVFDAGSHTEIVKEGHNGLLWESIEDLQIKTLKLINEPYPRELLIQAAMQSSERYCDVNAFAERVLKLIGL
jgi:glycosyltransferase involved in cell wall biosynthesis